VTGGAYGAITGRCVSERFWCNVSVTPNGVASRRARAMAAGLRSVACTLEPCAAKPKACVPMPQEQSSTERALPAEAAVMRRSSTTPCWRTLWSQAAIIRW
jgi:hypothetical protein